MWSWWADTRRPKSTLWPTIPVEPCSTAINSCTWTSDLWRCSTTRRRPEAAPHVCNFVIAAVGANVVPLPQFLVGLRKPADAADNGPMGGRSRQRIFGDRVQGARINAQNAREQAGKAIREADAAECLLWSEQMEGFGGPAQPSPTDRAMPQWRIWLAGGDVPPLREPRQPAARCHPPAARYADLEAGSGAQMPLLRQPEIRAAGSPDPADQGAKDRPLSLGSSRR